MSPRRAGVGRWLPALALLTLPLWVPAQQGDPAPDPLQVQLEQQRAVGERQRALLGQIRGSLASLSAEEQATLQRLDRLNTEIDRLRGQTELLGVRLRQTESRLGVTERDILALRARVGQLRTSVSLNLNSLYRERTGEYLALLAQAQTLPELLLRLRWANYAGERQVALIRELDQEVAHLQGELATQEQARAELKALQAQRQASLGTLSERQAEAQTLLAGLRRTASGQRLLEVQGQAELAQTGQNIQTLLDAAVRQQEQLAEQRRRDLETQRQRDVQTAERLRAASPAPAASAPASSTPSQTGPAGSAPSAPASLGAASSGASTPAPSASLPDTPAAPPSAREAPAASPAPAAPAPVAPTTPPAIRPPVSAAPAPAPSSPQVPAVQETAPPSPQQLAAAQTQAENAVQHTEAQLAPLPGRVGALAFPLPGGQISEAYTPESPWIVLRAGRERQVRAAADGVVLAVTSFSSLGWVVLLDHGEGLVTAYLGLSEPAVQVGERTAQGTPLGEIGGSPVFGPDAAAFQVSRVEDGTRTPLPPPF